MPDSEALRSITEALTLASRFALVIVVGPDDHPNLAQRVLVDSLHTAGLAGIASIPLHEGLDLPALFADADAPHALILTEPTQLYRSEREELLAGLNLQRDALAHLPLRLVYWCTHRGLEELRRVAPDFVHWRALLLPLDPSDLQITTLRAYLAWRLDALDQLDAADHPSDGDEARPYALPRDPLLVELHQPESPHARVKAGGMFRISTWTEQQPRGLIAYNAALSPHRLVSALIRRHARRGLRSDHPVPLPLLVESDALAPLLSGQLAPPQLQPAPLPWWRWPHGAIVFILDSDAPLEAAHLEELERRGAKPFILSACDTNDRLPAWPRALVMMTIDPFAGAFEPEHIAARGLADLLDALFDPARLQRFAADEFPPGSDLTPRRSARDGALGLLDLDNGATWDPFSKLSERLAAALTTTGRVTPAFFARLRTIRPRAHAEIEHVEQLFRQLPPDAT